MSRYKPKQAPAFATEGQILRMTRDNKNTERTWCLVNAAKDEVTLCNQMSGEPATQSITMRRKDLVVLARWFLKRVPMRRKS